jgi:hypothetical protein
MANDSRDRCDVDVANTRGPAYDKIINIALHSSSQFVSTLSVWARVSSTRLVIPLCSKRFNNIKTYDVVNLMIMSMCYHKY